VQEEGGVLSPFVFLLHICLACLESLLWVAWCVACDSQRSCLKFLQFRMCNASGLINDVWGAIWVGAVSEIWKHMNNVIFKRGVADASEVFAMVQVKVWSWIFSKSQFGSFSYSNLCLDPLACMKLVS